MVILVTELGRARFCRFIALLGVVGIASCGGGDAGAGGYADAPNETDGQTTLARGISIEEIELNQGTRIPIGFAGDWVDGPDRLGFVIASRDSLLRVHYVVDDDWEPREIEARLTLVSADKTVTVATQVAMVEHSSEPDTLDGTFWFELRDELGQTEAGTEYQVELWETVAGAGAQLDEGVAINPSDGPEPIGFEQVAMQIKVVLVPIEYDGQVPELSDEIQRQLVDNLYEQNPVTEVVWDVHSPVVYDDNLSSLASLLPVMSQLRAAEAVAPNVYYHALVDVGAQSLGGVFGISNIASAEQDDAANRVSATVLWSVNPATAADTFTHETGHAQGLAHVTCPDTDAAEPDPEFPHPDGRIGAWGFGVHRQRVYDPADAFDYMSYCSPTWVSDWTWTKTYSRIKTLTAWDFEGPTPRPEQVGMVLIGALDPEHGAGDPGGEAETAGPQWWIVPGVINPEDISGQDRFEFELDGHPGQVVEGWATLDLLSDGRTQWIKVALPTELERIRAITHIRADQVRSVDPDTIATPSAVVSDWAPSF